MKGPTHTFQGHSSNFYISMNQTFYHNCNFNLDSEKEADIFCQSFYGFNYKSVCYQQGLYEQSGKLGNQMHSANTCFSYHGYGLDISYTNCNNKRCKIWPGLHTNYKGLYDLVCGGNLAC